MPPPIRCDYAAASRGTESTLRNNIPDLLIWCVGRVMTQPYTGVSEKKWVAVTEVTATQIALSVVYEA